MGWCFPSLLRQFIISSREEGHMHLIWTPWDGCFPGRGWTQVRSARATKWGDEVHSWTLLAEQSQSGLTELSNPSWGSNLQSTPNSQSIDHVLGNDFPCERHVPIAGLSTRVGCYPDSKLASKHVWQPGDVSLCSYLFRWLQQQLRLLFCRRRCRPSRWLNVSNTCVSMLTRFRHLFRKQGAPRHVLLNLQSTKHNWHNHTRIKLSCNPLCRYAL